MDPDQTAPRGAVLSGSTLFAMSSDIEGKSITLRNILEAQLLEFKEDIEVWASVTTFIFIANIYIEGYVHEEWGHDSSKSTIMF